MMMSYLKRYMRIKVHINYPEYIILNTKDEINEFIVKVNSLITDNDIIELITQVFDKLLNYTDDDKTKTFNYNRLSFKKDIIDNEDSFIILDKATMTLIDKISVKLNELKAYTNGGFPYFFYKLICNDVIVKHLPY